MKKLFLFLFASLLSISMFAQSGATKAQAIPYDWSTGIHVSSEAGVGKWYVVMLRKEDGGPFNPNGRTDDGLVNINVSVVNPLDEEADIDVMAYIGENETNRHFKLAAGGIKSMTFGAGAFIKMGIDRVYLYLVMDVTITPEEAEAHEAVNVNVTPVESENTVVFVPIDFNWENWPNQTTPTVIPAGKETWVKIVFDKMNRLDDGETFVFTAQNMGAETTIYAGLSYDCPATSIQEESKTIAANAPIEKALDQAKLAIMPDSVYIRIKADEEIRLSAKLGSIPTPTGDPIFNRAGAIEVLTWNPADPEKNVYTLETGKLVYSVDYATLQAEEFYYKQIEVTNNSDEEVTIVGKASKTFDGDDNTYSVVSKSVTIPAHQTYVKKIDKSMQSVVGKAAGDKIWALGPLNANITFKLTEQCTEKDPCVPATAKSNTITVPAVGSQAEATQNADETIWYLVDIKAAHTQHNDIKLTMTADSEAEVTVDLAVDCALGEPTQSYTGSSISTSKVISYSLIETTDTVYVRVKTNKYIQVTAELMPIDTEIRWDGTKWSNVIGPNKDKLAYVDGPLTISAGKIIEVEDLYITTGGSITIEAGGALFVGKSGIKDATSAAIVVKDGGMLLISPEASATYSKPLVEAHKTLHLGQQKAYSKLDTDPYKATLPDLHEFITVPVTGAYDVEARYYYWDRVSGWLEKESTAVALNKACSPFVGYHVFTMSTDDHYGDYDAVFRGQLASNDDQSFQTSQIGWYAFGNAWFAPIKLSYLLDALDAEYTTTGSTDEANQKAVHTYVSSPMDVKIGTEDVIIKDNHYIPLTSEIAANVGISEIKPMQGFFLFTEEGCNIEVDYTKVWNDATGYGSTSNNAPKRVAAADDRNKAAVVLRGGNNSDFVYLIEGKATNASKMLDANLAIYAGNNLAQVASDNLIGTILTIKTNNATEYTLSFGWLNGETMYLRDLQNGVLIEMTEDNKYTFTAEPNTVSERFQVVGRNDAPTAIENTFIEGTNKVIENGKVVIIKNGVKYNVLGTQL